MHPSRYLLIVLLLTLTACAAKGPGHRAGPPPGEKAGQGHLANGAQIIAPGAILLLGFDEDGDYLIDEAEVARGLNHAFDRADQDGSGQLSLFEYRDWSAIALGSPTALPDWMTLDRNQDKTITREEFRKAFTRIAERHGLTQAHPLEVADLAREMEIRNQKTGSVGQSRGSGGREGRKGGGGRKPRAQI